MVYGRNYMVHLVLKVAVTYFKPELIVSVKRKHKQTALIEPGGILDSPVVAAADDAATYHVERLPLELHEDLF